MFKEAISIFLNKEKKNILTNVAERNLCGRLSYYMESLFEKYDINGYFSDTEYNRKQEGKIKTILDDELNVVVINCDLIVHSRGINIEQDNLIAIEMKKSNRSEEEKNSDRNRLRALTKDSYDDTWSYDGKTLPGHVCGYKLGFYIEIDRNRKNCLFECYMKGQKDFEWIESFEPTEKLVILN